MNCETQEEVDELWKRLWPRKERTLRMAEGQVLAVVTNHSERIRQFGGRQQRRQSTERDEGDRAMDKIDIARL